MSTEIMNQNAAARAGSYPAARIIARGWHGGSNRHMTGLSHGREWSTERLIEEIEQELSHLPKNQLAGTRMARAELEALLYWAKNCTTIVAVWSNYSHRFLAEDGYQNCLSCGAQFELVHDSKSDVSHGRLRGHLGEAPQECTGPDVSHENADLCNCLLH
jgi:hypothetical protein